MIRDGYFAHDERFELLDGLIIRKMPKDPIHEAAVRHARKVISGRLSAGWHVRVGGPVTLSESEPEPDLCVARGDELDFADHHPNPSEIALIVGVSNSTLTDDRNWKGPLYAVDGVTTYWMLNLIDWRVETYSDPTGPDPAPAFRRRQDFTPGQVITLVWSAGTITIPVDELLPAKLRPTRS
jgi:Uma2 family endonuclease